MQTMEESNYSEQEQATMSKIAEALKRGKEVVVFDGENRKQRRAAKARWRRSQNRSQEFGEVEQ